MQYTKKFIDKVERKGKNQLNQVLHNSKLLLLCDGKGTIGIFLLNLVFAHGDANIVDSTIKDLMHKHLFSLKFTLHSLKKLKKYQENGLLDPPTRKRKFTL